MVNKATPAQPTESQSPTPPAPVHVPTGPLIVETEAFRLTCEVCHKEEEVRVALHPKAPHPTVQSGEITDAIHKMGISGQVDEAALQHLCEKARHGQPQSDILLIRAVPPQPAQPPRLELLVLAYTDDVILSEHGQGHIDLHHLAHFENVTAGRQIAHLHPATAGTPGTSVFGNPIPPPPPHGGDHGAPKAGANVQFDPESGLFFSTAIGRVIYDKGKRELSVSDVYTIKGDTDLHVGDVDFLGSVEIRGNVLKGFKIRASKSLTVHGTVEDAELTAGGNIKFAHGMTGGRVVCGGTMTARYLDSVHVECEGDLTVANEIINCSIRSYGRVSSQNGALMGGTCEAQSGVDAKELGSPGNPPTTITVGLLAPCRAALQVMTARLATMSADDHERPKVMVEVERGRRSREHANPMVNVAATIHPGVTVTIGRCTECFRTRLEGGRALVPDPKGIGLLQAPPQPVGTRARDVLMGMLQHHSSPPPPPPPPPLPLSSPVPVNTPPRQSA